MFNPFETPWLLLIIGIVTLAIGSCIRNNPFDLTQERRSSRKGLWLILIGIAISGSAFGLDYLVKTDYEQLWGLIDTCRDAAVAGNARPIGPCISEQYRDSVHTGKTSLMSDTERILKMAGISKIRFRSLVFQISQNTARAQLDTAVFLDPQRSAVATGGLFFVEMSVEFQKENDSHWFITSAEIESVNNDRANWNIAR